MSLPLLIKALVLLDKGLTLRTIFNLNYLFKGPISKYSHMGIRASTYELGGRCV